MVRIYNAILLSHEKNWNTAIFNMSGFWDYHTKWTKSNGKGQEPCEYTYMRDIKQKATNEQTRQTHQYRQQFSGFPKKGAKGGG